ncbi:MAG: Stf0 family sulfotransferase [Bacteroidota bacterium]
MKPGKSFIIWFSPRSGSTLLCKALEATGQAGKAGEFLNIPEGNNFLDHYKVDDFAMLKEKLWSMGTSLNGIFGVKYSLYYIHYASIIKPLAGMQGIESQIEFDWAIFSDLFPNCHHIYLTRRNKIRQAVSWWKAIQNQLWHLEQGQEEVTPPNFYDDKYDFDALTHLFKEINLREAAMESFFFQNQIIPTPVIYEDFIRDYENTIYFLLTAMQIETKDLEIGPKPLKKTANGQSELWVQRFRKDLQTDWDRVMW